MRIEAGLPILLTHVETVDVRFPTSRELAGSDAMNPAPDYSAAYAILYTSENGLTGHGFTFTIGRGNEVCVAAIKALAPLLVGLTLEEATADMGGLWRRLAGDSQLRWLGPEKGVIHLALAALVNAVWDLWAKSEGVPVWRLVAEMEPEQLVSLVDFRHLTDALRPEEAIEIVREAKCGREPMLRQLQAEGYPAYTTSAGWLGYSDDKIRKLCGEAVAAGWSALKIKVGRDAADDARRCAVVRECIGERLLMIDANQVWEVDEAIAQVRRLAAYDPYWIEEPVGPDDVMGHAAVRRGVAPVRVATGEHAPNRVMFKQFLQADALDVVQFDACRLGGVNEAVAVLLLAAKFGKPVCQHAGGVGLCEVGQHLAMIDALCVSGRLDGRMLEHAGHLHEHFVSPIRIVAGRFAPPEQPGLSSEIKAESLTLSAYPEGALWNQSSESDMPIVRRRAPRNDATAEAWYAQEPASLSPPNK